MPRTVRADHHSANGSTDRLRRLGDGGGHGWHHVAGGAESGKPAVAADDFAARYAFCRLGFGGSAWLSGRSKAGSIGHLPPQFPGPNSRLSLASRTSIPLVYPAFCRATATSSASAPLRAVIDVPTSAPSNHPLAGFDMQSNAWTIPIGSHWRSLSFNCRPSRRGNCGSS
jgi:hypothetical protein